ncbi:PH domain-containing protein [Cellulomonas palmilytica]|uniref:PH domain-containing protein n=1 Tax=Cellulomonas palmilytica TaxID=2608402 RepID=UPI001F414174|nr:PH domain-containing protein [Cellulomonas palmilytica]UJP39513.1 PH domain-containing protein [Cellulomonas palmilytica]
MDDRATRIVMSHRLLRRYILPGERVVLAARRHWAQLVEPALTATGVFVLCAWLTLVLQPTLGDSALWVWWLWIGALARFGWLMLVWRVEWFVATDKRMLLLTGLVTHQIGMMPLMKVTDMRYSRSVLGQLLGYGQFLLESAGQDQALRQINWVARPDATYRDLCALIFTPAEPPPSDGEDDAGPLPPSVLPARLTSHGRHAAGVPERDDQPDDGLDEYADDGYADDDLDGAREHEYEYEPHDTQPLRVRPRAVRPAGEEVVERSWDVSEPTARFVDLTGRGRRHEDDVPDAPPWPPRPGRDDGRAR